MSNETPQHYQWKKITEILPAEYSAGLSFFARRLFTKVWNTAAKKNLTCIWLSNGVLVKSLPLDRIEEARAELVRAGLIQFTPGASTGYSDDDLCHGYALTIAFDAEVFGKQD